MLWNENVREENYAIIYKFGEGNIEHCFLVFHVSNG